MNNKTKALIKDLELQIDYLIGYQPSGTHWKQEYHLRKNLIEETLASNNTPPEIVNKIARIQDAIYKLRNGEKHDQIYIDYALNDYKVDRKIKVTYYNKTWFI